MKKCDVVWAKRLALDWTQKDLADLCGISASTVSMFECGKRISDEAYNKIMSAIEDNFAALDRTQRNVALLRTDVALLSKYDDSVELARALAYIVARASMIQADVFKEI